MATSRRTNATTTPRGWSSCPAAPTPRPTASPPESTMYLFSMIATVALIAVLAGLVAGSSKGRRAVVLALRSLWLHKLRAFLSVLGIIIGTGAVISLMAFGEGSMQDALEDIRRMGAT